MCGRSPLYTARDVHEAEGRTSVTFIFLQHPCGPPGSVRVCLCCTRLLLPCKSARKRPLIDLCCVVSPRRIKHANIVSLEEIFESKSHLYLVMQL